VSIKPEDLDKIGVKMKEPEEVTLETEYEKVKKIDIEDWEMVRGENLVLMSLDLPVMMFWFLSGPRPWEEQSAKI
jgi:Cytochrome c oxidase assembly protein COX16